MKSWNEIRKAGTVFSKRRKGAYDEKSRAQSFLKEFFEVFGIDTCTQATFEHRVKFSDGSQGFVDCFWGNDISGAGQGAGGVGGLLATRIDGVLYFPVYDGNGNIMMYVNAAGEVVAQYDYDPYGNTLQATGSLASQFAFGFSTKYHDREVGLVAYQLRVYNPVHGRWLNRDPIGEDGGENLYSFCGNFRFLFDEIGLIPAIRPVGPSPYVGGEENKETLWFAVFFEDIDFGDKITVIKHVKQDLYDCKTGTRLMSAGKQWNEEHAVSCPNTLVRWVRDLGSPAPYSSLMSHSILGQKKCRRGKIVFSGDFFRGTANSSYFQNEQTLFNSWFRYYGDDSTKRHQGDLKCFKGGLPVNYKGQGAFASVKVEVSYSCGKEDPQIVVQSTGVWRLLPNQRIDYENRFRGAAGGFDGTWMLNGRVVDFENDDLE